MFTQNKHHEKSFEVQPENTSLLVAEAFGIGPGWVNRIVDVVLPDPLPKITLITGESGCGKSTLLKMLGKLTPFTDPNKPLHKWADSDEGALRLLNSVGLNDASLFVLYYRQLSDSQQARARMYFWLCRGKKTLVVDEFLSTLDRKTAKALAYSFQRMLRREQISLIAATAHDDLDLYLQPDLIVRGKAFPSDWTTHFPAPKVFNPFASQIAVTQELTPSAKTTIGGTCRNCKKGVGCSCAHPDKAVSAGKDEYRANRLGEIHYKGKYVGGPQEYISARLNGEIIGWVVGTQLRTGGYRIARVVVHPTYRGCGVGQQLIRYYLGMHPDADTVAAMARFNPVFERAGMRRVADVDIAAPDYLRTIPLTVGQWASKKECQNLIVRNPKYRALVVANAAKLGRDTHPGGVYPGTEGSPYKSLEDCFRKNDVLAAQALWRIRPRKMAKYVGPAHKLFQKEKDEKTI